MSKQPKHKKPPVIPIVAPAPVEIIEIVNTPAPESKQSGTIPVLVVGVILALCLVSGLVGRSCSHNKTNTSVITNTVTNTVATPAEVNTVYVTNEVSKVVTKTKVEYVTNVVNVETVIYKTNVVSITVTNTSHWYDIFKYTPQPPKPQKKTYPVLIKS
jgi:hypothetical protein